MRLGTARNGCPGAEEFADRKMGVSSRKKELEGATKIELDADGTGALGLHTALLLGVAEILDANDEPEEIA